MHCFLTIPQYAFPFKLLEIQLCFPRSNRHSMSREQDWFRYPLYKNIRLLLVNTLNTPKFGNIFFDGNYPADQCSIFKPQLPSSIWVNVLKVYFLAQGSLNARSRLSLVVLTERWVCPISNQKLILVLQWEVNQDCVCKVTF